VIHFENCSLCSLFWIICLAYCVFMQRMVRRAASLVALASLLYVASAAVLPFHARGNVCVCVCVVSVANLCSCVFVCLCARLLSLSASLKPFVSFSLYGCPKHNQICDVCNYVGAACVCAFRVWVCVFCCVSQVYLCHIVTFPSVVFVSNSKCWVFVFCFCLCAYVLMCKCKQRVHIYTGYETQRTFHVTIK
jgi:hypothetical protein